MGEGFSSRAYNIVVKGVEKTINVTFREAPPGSRELFSASP